MNDSQILQLLELAKSGDQEAIGRLLEHYRNYLRNIAGGDVDRLVQHRIGQSDVIQQTCLSVCKRIKEFDGSSPQQFFAWLRRIHQNNMQNAIRDQRAGKRDVSREVRPDTQLMPNGFLQACSLTPSRIVSRKEQAQRVKQALLEIPAEQREALVLRHHEGLSLAEISRAMNKSETAVVGLIWRGGKSLKKRLNQDEGPQSKRAA